MNHVFITPIPLDISVGFYQILYSWGCYSLENCKQNSSTIIIFLVGDIPTLLKNMSLSVGMMKFPIYGKNKINVPNHQPVIYHISWKVSHHILWLSHDPIKNPPRWCFSRYVCWFINHSNYSYGHWLFLWDYTFYKWCYKYL